MRKLLLFCLTLAQIPLFGQTETYQFSKDILQQIAVDTTPWRYQVGATTLSFSGYHTAVLEHWDKNGVRKPILTAEDSTKWLQAQKHDAVTYILEQSKNTNITIINEAHHLPEHRIFTTSLLQGLYNNGYRYLGLEALMDTLINQRKYPITTSGYYTQEPEFGNLIKEALAIGFTLFGYEATPGKNGKDREIEQAENIQKYIAAHPEGKTLIHCGYAHAFENEYPSWGKAMAGRLKDNMNIDPLTIDQTMYLERANKDNTHPFMLQNNTGQPIVLINEQQIYNGHPEKWQTDIVVIHPITTHKHGRPHWKTTGKSAYQVPKSRLKTHDTLLILAYRAGEFENNGIPADIIEMTNPKTPQELYLSGGTYTIVLKNKDYKILDKYSVNVE